MDELPDAILQHILAHLSHARDVASCACDSRKWKEAISSAKGLYFPRDVFDRSREVSDTALCRMITSMECLEKLVVHCPFSTASLARWLSIQTRHLRYLELRMNMISEKASLNEIPSKLDCIGWETDLELLVLWEEVGRVPLTELPSNNRFKVEGQHIGACLS